MHATPPPFQSTLLSHLPSNSPTPSSSQQPNTNTTPIPFNHQANGTLSTPEPVPVSVDASAPAAGAAAAAAVPSFGQLMSFSGPAPELINGRLAMLGVVAALAAEFSSGESVWRQIADEPTGIVAVFGLIIAASFAPLLNNAKPESESFGPFNAAAERLNGRAAMIGIAALLVIEWFKGAALF